VKEAAVVDSACLIALERIGQLAVLTSLFEPIYAPPAVEREFGSSPPWLIVEAPQDQALVVALKMVVDDGEAEAIALACERRCRVILDDRQARSVAKQLALPLIGTVGVLVRAKHAGIILAVGPLLSALEMGGFFLSDSLKEEALRLAGE